MKEAPNNQQNTTHRPSFVKEAWATLCLALPLIAGQVGQMLMGVTDTVVIETLHKLRKPCSIKA